MSWLADLKCGDPRCGCTGNPIRVVVHTSNYVGIDDEGNVFYPSDVGMGLDMSGPVRRITGTTHDEPRAQYDATGSIRIPGFGSIHLRPGAYINREDLER